MELSAEQEKARLSLKRALNKCAKADLMLRVYEADVLLVVPGYRQCDEADNGINEECGYFSVYSNIKAD